MPQLLDDCIDMCALYNVLNYDNIVGNTWEACNAVCWRNNDNNNDQPGRCWGWQTMNSSSRNGWVVQWSGLGDVICDSAGWIDQFPRR